MVILWGAFVLMYVGLSAILIATLPSVIASYVYAYVRLWREIVVVRFFTQCGMLMLAMCVFTALSTVLSWWGLSSGSLSGKSRFGMELFEFRPFIIWTALSLPAAIVGEVMLAVRRRRDASPPSA